MSPRTDIVAASPTLFKAWYAFATLVGESGIEKSLLELVKIRASQINGCANWSGRRGPSPGRTPLRTGRATFAASGSSLH